MTDEQLDIKLDDEYRKGKIAGLRHVATDLMERAKHIFAGGEDDEAQKFRAISEHWRKKANEWEDALTKEQMQRTLPTGDPDLD